METNDPYAPPAAPINESLPPLGSTAGPVGSLAQSARGKHIGQARWILLLVGVLTLALNSFLLYNLPNEINEAVRANNVGPDDLESFKRTVAGFGYLLYGLPALAGVAFIVMGFLVKRFPVPITITGLVLYVALNGLLAVFNPASLASGIVVKLLFIAALYRAFKAAREYQSETKAAEAAGLIPG